MFVDPYSRELVLHDSAPTETVGAAPTETVGAAAASPFAAGGVHNGEAAKVRVQAPGARMLSRVHTEWRVHEVHDAQRREWRVGAGAMHSRSAAHLSG